LFSCLPLFAKFFFRLLFSNCFSFFFSALRSSLAQGQRALKVPQGPQPLLLAQARHHLVPATPLPPLWGAQQVWGVRPLHRQNTARRRIFPSLQRTRIPAPATSASRKKLPGGRSLRLLPSLKRRQLPRRKLLCRKVPTWVVPLAHPLLQELLQRRHRMRLAPNLPGLLQLCRHPSSPG
jgi:hypothetical protein